MLSIFKKDPARRMKKDYQQLVQKAYQAQQNGNIRGYSLLTAEAEKLKAKIDELN